MDDESEIISSSRGYPYGDNNTDQSTSKKKNYIARPPTFSEDSTKFEW